MQNNTPTQAQEQVYAGFFVRLAACLIDWLIVGAALLVVRIPMWIVSLIGGADFMFQDFIFTYSVYDILIYILKVGYFVVMTYLTGATVGKKLLQIRVVSAEERKPTFFEILFRESVGKFLSGLIVYVGYFIIGADKEKKGLHDILSDTRVIYYHKKTIVIPPPIEYHTVRFGGLSNPYFNPNQNASRQNIPNQNLSNQNAPNQNMPSQNLSSQNMPNQNMPNQNMPDQNMSYQNGVNANPAWNRQGQDNSQFVPAPFSQMNAMTEQPPVPETAQQSKQPPVPGMEQVPEQPPVPGMEHLPEQPPVPETDHLPEQPLVPETEHLSKQPSVSGMEHLPEQPSVPETDHPTEQPPVPGMEHLPEQPSMSEDE